MILPPSARSAGARGASTSARAGASAFARAGASPPLAPSHPSPRRVIRDASRAARARARAVGSLRAKMPRRLARARGSRRPARLAQSPADSRPSASSETEPRGVRDVLPARQNGAANESNADSSASNPPVDTSASATVVEAV